MMFSTRFAGFGVAVSVLAVAGGGVPTGAAAAVPVRAAAPAPTVQFASGFTEAQTYTDPGASVQVTCPAGSRLVGGIARRQNSEGYFSQLEPRYTADGGSSWHVQLNRPILNGQNPDPPEKVEVNATAICVRSGPATQIVSKTASVGSGRVEVSVPCPSGTRVVGGGGTTPGDYDHAGNLVSSFPAADLSSWNTAALHKETNGPISLTGFAVCAQPGPALQVISYAQPEGSFAPSQHNNHQVRCPAGTHLLGGGAEVRGGHLYKMLALPDTEEDPGSTLWRFETHMLVWTPRIAKFVNYAICESNTW